MKYTIGTRGSLLATIQTKMVMAKLQEAYPDDIFEYTEIVTKGDQITNKPLHEINDRGVFTSAIEEQLVNGKIDLAVHSMKDLPSKINKDCVLADAWEREDPRDVLILKQKNSLDELSPGSLIATGSLRRILQLKLLRPDIKTINIRGNVNTRLSKLDNEDAFDGIILAAAGLKRMGLFDDKHMMIPFDVKEMIPAPTQGTLAIELRKADTELLNKINKLANTTTNEETKGERTFLELMGGDCHLPIGAYCKKEDNQYHLLTIFSDAENKCVVKTDQYGDDPVALAKQASEETLKNLKGDNHE